ncbi:hypothetical protein ACJMK2_005102 [Sinanodonta woodiana]|uniref:Uncharacterized protein n=1 Tax=Sinanodonta woodiana TaxID=1069815 RepID=A0ABD3VP15_SINWO
MTQLTFKGKNKYKNQGKTFRGSKSRLHFYFDVHIEGNTLFAYHNKGCQLIECACVEKKKPRQAEILAALQAKGVNMRTIQDLQSVGRKQHMFYPLDLDTPLLDIDSFNI